MVLTLSQKCVRFGTAVLILCAMFPMTAQSLGVQRNITAEMLKADLVNTIEKQSNGLITEMFCVLDSDHDGVLTKQEAAKNIARSLGKDPEHFYELWVKGFNCQQSSLSRFLPSIDPNGTYQPGIFSHVVSATYLTIGRVDWHPCRLEHWLHFVAWKWQEEMPDAGERMLAETVTEDTFVRMGQSFLRVWPTMEDTLIFETKLDHDKDGCLSPAEWDQFDQLYQNMTYRREYGKMAPESPHLKQYQRPPSLNDSFGSGACLDRVSYTIWAVAGIYNGLKSLINETRQCKMQIISHPEESQQPLSAKIILGLVLGFCTILCAGSFAVMARYRYHRKKLNQAVRELDEASNVNKLLKAKIDAWSIFDANLSARTSSLQPAFVHTLALDHYALDTLNLLDIVKADDVGVVQSMLKQFRMEQEHRDSVPSMTTIHLEHGATGKTCKEYESKYIYVELLMARVAQSQSSVVVGITAAGEEIQVLAEERPVPPLPDPAQDAARRGKDHCDESVFAASAHSNREFILNGSDVTDFEQQSDVGTFRSMQVIDYRHVNDFKTLQVCQVFGIDCVDENWSTTTALRQNSESPNTSHASSEGPTTAIRL
eukprot:TRINITY_DN24457_c0_g1_i1.p1 TRINITY_DN24457_c0_g1~~TRINITY_DN24457_c0_g1_i1.p1  ORF type:complete len:598 (+),score=65.50 TRINITY_DN24457_c0_g1_i1:23-1816(+)